MVQLPSLKSGPRRNLKLLLGLYISIIDMRCNACLYVLIILDKCIQNISHSNRQKSSSIMAIQLRPITSLQRMDTSSKFTVFPEKSTIQQILIRKIQSFCNMDFCLDPQRGSSMTLITVQVSTYMHGWIQDKMLRVSYFVKMQGSLVKKNGGGDKVLI